MLIQINKHLSVTAESILKLIPGFAIGVRTFLE